MQSCSHIVVQIHSHVVYSSSYGKKRLSSANPTTLLSPKPSERRGKTCMIFAPLWIEIPQNAFVRATTFLSCLILVKILPTIPIKASKYVTASAFREAQDIHQSLRASLSCCGFFSSQSGCMAKLLRQATFTCKSKICRTKI